MSKQILDIEFNKLKEDIIKLYDSKGMRSSGGFADSLEVKVTNNNAKIIGNKYAEQLEYGRRKGKRPPIKAIKKWINDKGIVSKIKNDNDNSTLAFLIARKIGKLGWNRNKYKGVKLISKVVTEIRMQSIIDKVGNKLTMALVNRLEKELIKIK